MRVARVEFILKTKSIRLHLGVRERVTKAENLEINFWTNYAKGILCSGFHERMGCQRYLYQLHWFGPWNHDLHTLFGPHGLLARDASATIDLYRLTANWCRTAFDAPISTDREKNAHEFSM